MNDKFIYRENETRKTEIGMKLNTDNGSWRGRIGNRGKPLRREVVRKIKEENDDPM